MHKIISSDEHENGAGSGQMVSAKPLPDESNREDIELMLLHAFEFAAENKQPTAERLRLDQAHVAEGRQTWTMIAPSTV